MELLKKKWLKHLRRSSMAFVMLVLVAAVGKQAIHGQVNAIPDVPRNNVEVEALLRSLNNQNSENFLIRIPKNPDDIKPSKTPEPEALLQPEAVREPEALLQPEAVREPEPAQKLVPVTVPLPRPEHEPEPTFVPEEAFIPFAIPEPEVVQAPPLESLPTQFYPRNLYSNPPKHNAYRENINPLRIPNNQRVARETPEEPKISLFQGIEEEDIADRAILEGLESVTRSNVHITPPYNRSYLDENSLARSNSGLPSLVQKLDDGQIPSLERVDKKLTFGEEDPLKANIANRYIEPLFDEQYRDANNLVRVLSSQPIVESQTIALAVPPSSGDLGDLDDDELTALLLYARLYAVRGRYSEALLLLRFIQQRNPSNVVMLNMKGSIYYKINRLEVALAYWQRSLELSPYQALVRAYHKRVETYLAQLQNISARATYGG